MNLTNETIKFLQTVVQTAKLVNIDNVIIEPNCVRAIDDDKTVVIYHNEDVPSLPFGSIGLNRINDFLTRLDIAKTQDNFSITANVDDTGKFSRSLLMSGKGIKIDYRCAKPDSISAPRQINDNEMKVKVFLNSEAVILLQKGKSAMSSDVVSIISNNDEVSFEMVDVNNDVFKHTFSDNPITLSGNDNIFANRYPVDTLLALFKQNPETYFEIGKNGMLKINVNDLDIYVLPKV